MRHGYDPNPDFHIERSVMTTYNNVEGTVSINFLSEGQKGDGCINGGFQVLKAGSLHFKETWNHGNDDHGKDTRPACRT